MNISALVAANAARWARVQTLRQGEFVAVAKRLVAGKARYQVIEKATGVPWFIIAVIHEREASGNFSCQLAQGDPLHAASIHVPKGRGPFATFEAGALDALIACAPHAAAWKDWSPGGALALLEQYNGLGYYEHGKPSPYIWSGTNQYISGKYVADGVYAPNVVDRQLGCAGLLLAMQGLDISISFSFGAKAPTETHVANEHPAAPAPHSDTPRPTPPAPPSWFAWLLQLLFGRR